MYMCMYMDISSHCPYYCTSYKELINFRIFSTKTKQIFFLRLIFSPSHQVLAGVLILFVLTAAINFPLTTPAAIFVYCFSAE